MKKTITKYICDCCKKELEKEDDLTTISVPSRNYDCEGKSYSKGLAKVEICKDCFNYYWSLCIERFADTQDCYAITMDKKF